MRWSTCLLFFGPGLLAHSIDNAQEHQDRQSSEPHGLSHNVQQALDELRTIATRDSPVRPTRTKEVLNFVRSFLPFRTTSLIQSSNHKNLYEAPIERLKEASEDGDTDALFLLAELSFHGNYSYPRDYHDALKYYTQLAEANGNLTALENVALLHSTGLQGVLRDQGLALTYHTFAAAQGSMRSQMALGFRYLNGIGVSPNCSAACEYYATAADSAIEWVQSGPPGGMYWSKRAFRFSDEYGGLYGGAPTFFSGGVVTPDSAAMDDVIDYYTYVAEKSDVQASFELAKLYTYGSATVQQDFVKSLYWFRQVAKTYWTKDGKTVKGVKPMKYHAKSAALIATAYLRGEGTDQDFDKAKIWFQRGLALGDSSAQDGYALMHLHGLGPIRKDVAKAQELFKAAADNEHRGAQVNLGKLLASKGDYITAARLFESAVRAGRAEAFYYLAQFFHHGIGREKDCAMATQYYKIVAESVETLQSTIPFGNEAYREGRIEDAVIANIIAAESGYENGQVNVAFLLDKHRRAFSSVEYLRRRLQPQIGKIKKFLALDTSAKESLEPVAGLGDELALLYYTRSAAQQNLEALVKAGDYHLEGRGTAADAEKAISLYTTAADSRVMPLALWNLGWSYENGIGVDQDFHLAKRYYDACLESDKRAYLPVSLSLLKLRARSAWNTITGGPINSIHKHSEGEEGKAKKTDLSTVLTNLKHYLRSQWETSDYGGDGQEDAGRSASAGPETFIDEDYPVGAAEELYDTLFIFGVCLLVMAIVYARTAWWPQPTRRPHGARGAAAAAGGGGGGGEAAGDPAPHFAEWIGGAAI